MARTHCGRAGPNAEALLVGNGSHERLGQRPDRRGVEQGADADGTTEEHADEERGCFDGGAGHTDGVTASCQTGHEAIAWSGSEPRADVQGRRRGVEADAGDQHEGPPAECRRLGDDDERAVDDGADDDDVAEGPQAWTFPERDPGDEHTDSDDVDDPADGDAEVVGSSLMEHVPGPEPEACLHHEPEAQPE